MYEFLKKILSPKGPEPCTISLADLPAWINENEERIHRSLLEKTAQPILNIKNEMAKLKLIVTGIADAEQDPAIHPKLKTIAKNSLPLFVRAVKSAVSKDLPEDPEEFYTAAVDSVKSCLNGVRGQGRYLQIVFPSEMKAVRAGIDVMGREINTMTAILGDSRKEISAFAEVRALHATHTEISRDLEKSEGKGGRIKARISDMSARITSIGRELDALDSDPRLGELTNLVLELESMTRQRDDAAREYASLSMTASHVFRKAEKISIRQHHGNETAVLKKTMDLLSDHTTPDCAELVAAIGAASPIVLRMIDEGEIPLKNKEERGLFSDTSQFSHDIGTICSTLRTRDEECQKIESTLASHPLSLKKNSLNRENEQLKVMLAKETEAREELSQWREKTRARIPEVEEELKQKIRGIIGGPCNFV